jgi:long-chain fatty acid transport protein
MKKAIGIGLGLLFLGCAVNLFGGSVDHNNNFSAGYVRTFNRNAVTDAPDAAVYNPAGTVKLKKGLYLSTNNQSVFKNYYHETASAKYSAKNPTFFLPSAFVVYNGGRWAAFGAFTVPGGGGSLKYDDSIADLDEYPLAPLDQLDQYGPNAKLYSAYFAGTIGAAYELFDVLSLSVGGRYVNVKEKGEFTTDTSVLPLLGVDTTTLIDYEKSASGFGAIIGVNIAPLSGLNIGIRYETVTKLEFEYDKAEGPLASSFGYVEGAKEDCDLPALLGVGVSYYSLPKLRTEASFMYYFNSTADWDGAEDDHDNGFEIGAAVEYSLLSNLDASLGFLYTDQGADDESYVYLNPALKALTICGGGIYDFTEDLSFELGLAGIFYSEDSGESQVGIPVDMKKTAFNVALGVQYKIF